MSVIPSALTPAQRQIDEWLRNDGTYGLYIEDDLDMTELPTIPSTVSHLVIRNCPKLEHIYALPTNLKHLQINNCPLLQTLPYTMPPKLYYMDIQTETCISILPQFVDTLDYLIINQAKHLHHIELLPSSLSYIYIRNTPIQTLPTQLPPNLVSLVLSNTHVTHLPPLPDSLDSLEISSPHLESIPSLPPSLHTIRIRNSPVRELPPLPPHVYELDAGNTKLTTVPALPPDLKHLYVDSTSITELPELPPGITMLSCANTNLQRLPQPLPSELSMLNLSYTPIHYLRAADFANTHVYQMQTHARTWDRFPESVKYIHFSHPEFQILDQPSLSETTITFSYEGEHTIVNPKRPLDIANYLRLKHKERNKQRARIAARTHAFKEDLMITTWHPSRVEAWCGVRFDTAED